MYVHVRRKKKRVSHAHAVRARSQEPTTNSLHRRNPRVHSFCLFSYFPFPFPFSFFFSTFYFLPRFSIFFFSYFHASVSPPLHPPTNLQTSFQLYTIPLRTLSYTFSSLFLFLYLSFYGWILICIQNQLQNETQCLIL